MTEVVVTGLGIVSSLGIGTDGFWDGLISGRSAAAPIEGFDASNHPVRFACEVRGFDPTPFIDVREASRMDRVSQFVMAAAQMAWDDAGLQEIPPSVKPERAGAVIGTGVGGAWTYEKETEALLKGGPRKVGPTAALRVMGNAAAGNLAIRYGLMGPNHAVTSACATGAHALGNAYLYLKAGMADLMLAGAAEAAITPLWASVFAKMGALSRRNEEPQKASRPFDADRDGFVMGEGAGMLVLERREFAEARGAPIIASVAGYGATNDAHHLVQPHPTGQGAILAMRAAMEGSGVSAEELDLINPHGTSTPYNDRAETLAIKEVFGHEAKRLAISATKSQIGHAMGAAGALEAIATLLSMKHSAVPGTINLETPDPECDLDYVADGSRDMKIRAALSNSFGLGGHCAAILFKAV